MSSDLKVTNIKHDSSSSNNLVLASDGNVSITNTLSAGTIGGGVSMASSGKTIRNITQVALASDQTVVDDATLTTFFSPTYTPIVTGTVQGCLTIMINANAQSHSNGRKDFKMEFTGSNITDITYNATETVALGSQDSGGDGVRVHYATTIMGPLITTSGNSLITCNCKMSNGTTHSTVSWTVFGDNTLRETFMTWIEYK
mgnify:CR=1 FL=1